MAIDQCNLCNDPCVMNGYVGNNSMQETWRMLVAQALCQINTAVGAPVTVLPEIAIGHAVLQSTYAAYADPLFMSGQNKLRKLRVYNTSDALIELSLDGGNNTFLSVPAASDTGLMSLGNVILNDPSDFKIRRASGDSATSGVLYIQGSY